MSEPRHRSANLADRHDFAGRRRGGSAELRPCLHQLAPPVQHVAALASVSSFDWHDLAVVIMHR